jgi:hypothetical protein
MQRRGLVLATLMRLKQICNHPSLLLGDDRYDPGHSGKFTRLAELCEELASRQEKLLVFTQFREITDPWDAAAGEKRLFCESLRGGTDHRRVRRTGTGRPEHVAAVPDSRQITQHPRSRRC